MGLRLYLNFEKFQFLYSIQIYIYYFKEKSVLNKISLFLNRLFMYIKRKRPFDKFFTTLSWDFGFPSTSEDNGKFQSRTELLKNA